MCDDGSGGGGDGDGCVSVSVSVSECGIGNDDGGLDKKVYHLPAEL